MNTSKDAEESTQIDPFDPMNTPVRPGMTKEEIFDIMAEKLIRQGQKITPDMKDLMEMLAEEAEKELQKRGKNGSDRNHEEDSKQ